MPDRKGHGASLEALRLKKDSLHKDEKSIGEFLLGKTLGKGSFGCVKLCRHATTEERACAKVLEKSRVSCIDDVKRISREIRILKQVHHVNIIQLYEVIDTATSIYFVTECCDGGELYAYIVRHTKLQELQAAFFFKQILDGVAYLHDQEISHRDLKPENILLQSSPYGWRLKIIDFGLSNTHEGGRLLQTGCGSPSYCAPEMIAGKKYNGPLVDIWSMGVILFALVSGHLPFDDNNQESLYTCILTGYYQCPKWFSPELTDLVAQILDTEPKSRASMEKIRQHTWLKQATTLPTPTQVFPTNADEVDKRVLEEMESLGFKPDETVSMLLNNRHCNTTTTYVLLLKKFIRQKEQQEYLLRQREIETLHAEKADRENTCESGDSQSEVATSVTVECEVSPVPRSECSEDQLSVSLAVANAVLMAGGGTCKPVDTAQAPRKRKSSLEGSIRPAMRPSTLASLTEEHIAENGECAVKQTLRRCSGANAPRLSIVVVPSSEHPAVGKFKDVSLPIHMMGTADVVPIESSGTHTKENSNVRATFALGGGANAQPTGVFSLLSPAIRKSTVHVDVHIDTSRRSSAVSDSSTESGTEEESSTEERSGENKIARPPDTLKPSKPSANPARKLSLPKAVIDVYHKVVDHASSSIDSRGTRGGSISRPSMDSKGSSMEPKNIQIEPKRQSFGPKSPTAIPDLPKGSSTSPRVLRAVLVAPTKDIAQNTCTVDVAQGTVRVEQSRSDPTPANTGKLTIGSDATLPTADADVSSTAHKDKESGTGCSEMLTNKHTHIVSSNIKERAG